LARRVGRWYFVENDGIREKFKEMFQSLLHELICEEGDPRISDVSQLLALRKGLGLFWGEVQDVFHAEARSLLNGEEPPSEAELTKPFLKLIWLSQMLFSTSLDKVSNEILVSEILKLSEEAAQNVVDRVSSILYAEAVQKAYLKYEKGREGKEAMYKAQAALCMSDGAATEASMQIYAEQVDLLLQGDGGDLADHRSLDKFKEILDITNIQSRRFVEKCLDTAVEDMAKGKGDTAFDEVERVLKYCYFASDYNKVTKDFRSLNIKGSDAAIKKLADVSIAAHPDRKDLLEAIFSDVLRRTQG